MSAGWVVAREVPIRPKFFIYIIGLIILLSVVILALAAYAQSLSGNYFYQSGVPGFLLFASIWTWLIYGGMLAIEHFAPQFYYRIVIIVGQLLSVIFWLSAWAWAASWASYTLSFENPRPYDRIRGAWMAFGQTIAACAGIGAGAWVLCIIALVVFCSACKRSSRSALAPAPANDMELANTSSSQGKAQAVHEGELLPPPPQIPNSEMPCI
ncbi:hypothetical protein F4859DRAFT_524209 [Xylaria cf. heliscus]|nr:hypothetical protein F4859DRAFT_524209 [Xylaria cf. heliscus]